MVKKLFFIVITLATLVMTGCSSGDQDLLRAVPEDTEVLARIDMKATAQSMGYSWTDMIAMAAKRLDLKEGNNGIDMTGTAYAFITEGARMNGLVLPVQDNEALRNYFTSNGETISETDGVFHVGQYAVFDKKRLVIALGNNTTSFDLHSLLQQERVSDDVEELNEQLETVEDPIAIVVDGDIVKKQGARDFTTGMALATIPVDWDDIFILVGIDATHNSAIISTSITAEDSEAQDQLEAIKKQLHPIKGGKIPFVADKYVALIATNLRGSDLKPYTAMLGGIDTDELMDALNGLVTFTLTDWDSKSMTPAFTFTAQANDIACLDKLMDQVAGFGLQVKNEGHHNWTLPIAGDNMLVGAYGGYVFANYGNDMKRPNGSNTISLEDGTVAYMHLRAGQIPELSQYGVNDIVMYSTDEMTAQATITLNRTWKEIIEKH